MAPPKPQSDPFVATSGSNPKRKRDPSGTPKSDSDADESESDTEGDDEKGLDADQDDDDVLTLENNCLQKMKRGIESAGLSPKITTCIEAWRGMTVILATRTEGKLKRIASPNSLMLEKNGTWRSRSFPDQMLLPTQLHFKDGQKVEKFNAAALPFIHALSTTPHLFEAYKGLNESNAKDFVLDPRKLASGVKAQSCKAGGVYILSASNFRFFYIGMSIWFITRMLSHASECSRKMQLARNVVPFARWSLDVAWKAEPWVTSGSMYLVETMFNVSTQATKLGQNSIIFDYVSRLHIATVESVLNMIRRWVALAAEDRKLNRRIKGHSWEPHVEELCAIAGGIAQSTLSKLLYGRCWGHLIRPMAVELGVTESLFVNGRLPAGWLSKAELARRLAESPRTVGRGAKIGQTDQAWADSHDRASKRNDGENRKIKAGSRLANDGPVQSPKKPKVRDSDSDGDPFDWNMFAGMEK